MGDQVLGGELTSRSKTNQSEATREQAPKDSTPQTEQQLPKVAGATLEKKDSVRVDQQKPQSVNSASARAKLKLPNTETEYHKNQGCNVQENKQSDPLQSDSCSTTEYLSRESKSLHSASAQSAKPTPYGYKQSAITKNGNDKKEAENFSKHSAAKNEHQQAGREKLIENDMAPTTLVNVAIIEWEVNDEWSVDVAHIFISEVANQQKLKANIVPVKGCNPDTLLQNLVKCTKTDAFRYIVLLVKKEVFRNISTDKRKLTSYTDLLSEIQANAGTQAVLIVCNDEDPIPHDQVHSKSVGNILKHVNSSETKIDENIWIALSWNECDRNFSLEKYIQYLVGVQQLAEAKTGVSISPGEYEESPSCMNATTISQGSFAPALSANHGRRLEVNPVVLRSASQDESSNMEDRGNIVWEGWLESGRLMTTYQRPNWKPPPELYNNVYEENCCKRYTEFQVEQTEDGGFMIKADSRIRGLFKRLQRSMII